MDGNEVKLMDTVIVDYPTGLAIDYFHYER